MTDYLVELIKQTPPALIGRVAYLTQGKIYPDFTGVEIGIAEQMALTAIAKAANMNKEAVTQLWKEIGDLGLTTEKVLKDRPSRQLLLSPSTAVLTVETVYDTLVQIAKTPLPPRTNGSI